MITVRECCHLCRATRKRGPRLRELAPAARDDQDAGLRNLGPVVSWKSAEKCGVNEHRRGANKYLYPLLKSALHSVKVCQTDRPQNMRECCDITICSLSVSVACRARWKRIASDVTAAPRPSTPTPPLLLPIVKAKEKATLLDFGFGLDKPVP